MPMVATVTSAPRRPSRTYGGPRGVRTHKGVDLYGQPGEAITAPAAGVVRHAHREYAPGFGLYGRVVVVALDGGGQLLVAHLEDVRVRQGQRVEQGDVLGTVGDTEFTAADPTKRFTDSEPHAHVELLPRGSYPVRKAKPRADPSALAFYVEKKKAA